MRRVLALVLLAACSEENPYLVIERQPAPLAQATAAGWTPGSVLVTGQPGTFTFPQPLALRFSIVDEAANADGVHAPLAIAMGKIQTFGTAPLQITQAAACEAMACTAEVSITGQGSSMLAVDAQGPKGTERECFYYSIVEGTSVDTAMLREELESQQQDCKYMGL